MSMSMQIQSTIPVLASLSLDESVAFYTERLGFTVAGRYDDYAIVLRDGAEIHFWLCTDRRIAENTSCYIRVASAQKLYEDLVLRGLTVDEPVVRPWGMKEVYVIDPHGNLLKFGEPV